MTVTVTATANRPEWHDPRPEPAVRLRDNPVATAFARRLLRPAGLVPSVTFAGVLGAVLAWASTRATALEEHQWLYVIGLVFVAAPIILAAPSRIATAVAHDRATGLMDVHRSSPTTPATNVAGYVLGSSVRDVMCSAALLPFVAFLAFLANVPALAFVATVAAIAAHALFLGLFAAAAGTLVDATRVQRAAAAVVYPLIVSLTALVACVADFGHRHHVPTYLGLLSPLAVIWPGVPLAMRAASVAMALGASTFAFRIAARRFAREDAVPFARADALAFVVTVLSGHVAYRLSEHDLAHRMVGSMGAFALAGFAVMLAASAVVPSRTHVVAWARRTAAGSLADTARKLTLEGSTVVPLTLAFGAIAASATAVSCMVHDGHASTDIVPLLGALVLVPTIVIASHENSIARHPRVPAPWTAFALGLVLVVPLVASGLATFANVDAVEARAIAELSPLSLPAAARAGGTWTDHPLPWITSLLAIAFFVTRGHFARRALVARFVR